MQSVVTGISVQMYESHETTYYTIEHELREPGELYMTSQ